MADMVQACMIQVVNSCVLNLGFVQELGIVWPIDNGGFQLSSCTFSFASVTYQFWLQML
jgi:hypothetical protein